MVSAVLKSLSVAYNDISGDAAQQLAAAAFESKSLEVFSEVPIKELRQDQLSELDLSGKGLGPTEAILLSKLINFSAVLTDLNLCNNSLGVEGGTARGQPQVL